MNSVILIILLVPIIEIYLFIKIGSQIGAFYTISLIMITAVFGLYYAKYEGLIQGKEIDNEELILKLGKEVVKKKYGNLFQMYEKIV